MKKILLISFLIFFVHTIFLFLLLANMNQCELEKSVTPNNGMYSFIAFFCSSIIFLATLTLFAIEYLMKCNFKIIIFLLVYINCILEFYLNSITQYRLFTNSERFDNSAIILVTFYFSCELVLTFIIINKLYKPRSAKFSSSRAV